MGRSRLVLGIRARGRRVALARAHRRPGTCASSPTRERGDSGISIIELVVAFAVLLIVLIPIAILLTNVLGQSATARDKLTALSLAEKCLEKLNNTGPTLSDGVPETSVAITENSHCFASSPVTESTISYDVHAEFTWETNQGDHPDLCTSSDTATLIEAQVWTTWAHTQKVTDTTLLDYPPPGLPDDGFLAIVVNGTPAGSPPTDASGRAWSTRVQSVPVTITRTGFSVTLYPNSYGCIFEEVPAPDSYKVTAKNPTVGGQPASPAWVSATKETATASTTVTANLDTVTHVTFRYDEGSLVKLSYPSTTATEGPVTCPAAGQVDCVVFGQEPKSSTTPATSPEAELSVLDTTTKKWSVTTLTSASRLAALACAGTNQCIAVGYGGTTATGVSLSSPTTSAPSFTTDTVPPGVTTLSGITCPASTLSTRCYAWGLSSSGAVILTGTVTSISVTWGSSVDTLATVPARVTSIACWSASRCYALGTKKTGTTPVVLSLSTTTSRKWTTDTVESTVLTLTDLVCPATTKCYAVGTRKTGTSTTDPALVSLESTGKKLTKVTLPTTVTALTQLACTSGTVCYAIGTHKTGTVSYGAIISLTGTSWKVDTPKKTVTSVTAITCPSTSACLAMGTSTSDKPALLWRTGTTTFTSETVPSVTALWAIACASGSDCFAIGAAATHAVVISGTTSWSLDTLPATPTAVAFFGLACGGPVCAAPGATETGAVYFDGTPTGTSWSNATPTGAEGMYLGSVPIEVTSSSLTTHPIEVTLTVTAHSGTSDTQALFPFSAGYSMAATECSSLPVSVKAASAPGATSTATMPMGLLSLRVVNKYGNPDTGATIAATPSCTRLETTPPTFKLEPTATLGLSQLDVPYGTYKLKVSHTVTRTTHTVTVTVTVEPTSVKQSSGTAQSPSAPLVVSDT